MEPQYILTQQILVATAAIEQNLRFLYDPNVSYDQKQIVLSYLYPQTRQLAELVSGLFTQYRQLEGR
jgi:hypothetical protein